MEFSTPELATAAINIMHGAPFDAKHTFLVNRFAEIHDLQNLDESYEEPPREEFAPLVRVQ